MSKNPEILIVNKKVKDGVNIFLRNYTENMIIVLYIARYLECSQT
jgi:hypothetical protein